MPIYEYKCKKGHVFDVMQSVNDEPVTKCEVCGASVQRVFHPPSVHFKGSGFYNTDYGTRKRAREKESSSEGVGSKEPATSTSSDSSKDSSSSNSNSNSNSSSNSDSSSKKPEKAAASK
jgi:putative FmdB family regulatory protein